LAGLCLPFAARSRSADWNPQRTLIQNAQESHVQLMADTRKPRFAVVRPGEENRAAYVIQFEETQLFMEFDPAIGTLEIQRAVQAHFPGNHDHIPPGDPVSGHIRFEGWAGHPAKSAPYAWALAASLGCLLVGALLIRAFRDKVRS
jgi:hypothetical protein